ncbi:MAG: transposase [Candidatus Omnitrophica bacterium]|nr:transposase [Candidatus Omnitrophota bacterium]MDD5253464.1 transposase [Candidatus Omnitrophota bacterium]
MPRIARNLVDNNYYHIVTRGLDRRRLFRHKQDYELFLETTAKYLKQYKIHILHYCLMPNHLHILIKAEVASDLPKFMQVILQVYAAGFRKKYKSTGFVFQNRYKSRLISNDSYLLECARYIEYNPVRAKIVADASEYPWSSFSYYAKGAKDKIITLTNPLYLDMAANAVERKTAYIKFISEARLYDSIIDKEFKIS